MGASGQVTKVKGHADEDMVRTGKVRVVDNACDDLVARAVEFGWRRSPLRLLMLGACILLCVEIVVSDLQRYFLAVLRALVKNDGHGFPPLIPWYGIVVGNLKGGVFFRLCESLLGFQASLTFGGNTLVPLMRLCALLCSLHWPPVVEDEGVSGMSYVELLLLYECWAVERLVSELAVPKARRSAHPILVSAVAVGPSIDVWRSCRFLGVFIAGLVSASWVGREGGAWALHPLSHWCESLQVLCVRFLLLLMSLLGLCLLMVSGRPHCDNWWC